VSLLHRPVVFALTGVVLVPLPLYGRQTPETAQSGSKPTLVKTEAAGSATTTFPSGDTIKTFQDGHGTTTLPQGYTIKEDTNQISVGMPSGATIERNSEGKYFVTTAGQLPQVLEIPKATTEVLEKDIGGIHVKMEGGGSRAVFTLPGGTQLTVFNKSVEGPNAIFDWSNGDTTTIERSSEDIPTMQLPGEPPFHTIVETTVRRKNDKGELVAETRTREDGASGRVSVDSYTYSVGLGGRSEKTLEKSETLEPTITIEKHHSIVRDLFGGSEEKPRPKDESPKPAPEPKTDSSFDGGELELDGILALGSQRLMQQNQTQTTSAAAWGGGVKYFLTPSVGLGASLGFTSSDTSNGVVLATATLRFPHGAGSPYVFGGAGARLDGGGVGTAGAGFDYRFTPAFGLFVEGSDVLGSARQTVVVGGGLTFRIR